VCVCVCVYLYGSAPARLACLLMRTRMHRHAPNTRGRAGQGAATNAGEDEPCRGGKEGGPGGRGGGDAGGADPAGQGGRGLQVGQA